ncbi:hypothetical protein WJX74_001943 [Apatococcus lobatus]|uniref:Uncharacterized protein n=1 Tax=Apatococcus lobatus TaxID=904363 RepID=A0AAW1QBE9_9CHLO
MAAQEEGGPEPALGSVLRSPDSLLVRAQVPRVPGLDAREAPLDCVSYSSQQPVPLQGSHVTRVCISR